MRISTVLCFFFFMPVAIAAQNRYDVVISEIMADPTPAAGLPAYEWIELTNTSTLPVNLSGWRVGDAGSRSGPLPSLLLLPDSMVILCSSGAVAALSPFGKTLAVTSFPSLDNEGDLLYITASNGKTIHAVQFTTSWYRNELKKEGGWSLEMTDLHNPCAGMNNWSASTAVIGGSPGKINSVHGLLPDREGPRLLRTYTTGPSALVLVFDEPVDSTAASAAGNYELSDGPAVLQGNALPPLFREVLVSTTTPLAPRKIYTVKTGALTDCKGNPGAAGEARTGIAEDPQAGEWVINELLFNPRANGDDYAEFYNNGHKILDASRLLIAGRNSSGALVSSRPLSESPFLIFPGDLVAITPNAAALAREYLVRYPSHILEAATLPSFPDEEGTVVALNFQGEVVDELHYSGKWHFKLLQSTEGISLERIDPDGATQAEQNWHSAASTAGYGTPGYANSQYHKTDPSPASFGITPRLFSPDNDGYADIARIQYSLEEPGYLANVVIYTSGGLAVCTVAHNALLGLSGYWNWNGLNDNGQQLPAGTYVVFAEFFNLQGKKIHFKQALVLARHLQ